MAASTFVCTDYPAAQGLPIAGYVRFKWCYIAFRPEYENPMDYWEDVCCGPAVARLDSCPLNFVSLKRMLEEVDFRNAFVGDSIPF